MSKSTFASEASKRQMERIVELLDEPMSAPELAEWLGISHSMTCRYLKYMTGLKPREVRVCGWVEVGSRRRKVAMFKRGSGRNVPEPPAMTLSEKWKLDKANPWVYQKKLASWRRSYHKRKGQTPPAVKPASLFAALGI